MKEIKSTFCVIYVVYQVYLWVTMYPAFCSSRLKSNIMYPAIIHDIFFVERDLNMTREQLHLEVRKLRKKIRQIENLERLDRDLNDEEIVKVCIN